MVYSPGWGSRYATILFKYVAQSVRTLRLLFREDPAVTIVMTPPIVACLPVWLYGRLRRGSFAIDAHTAAFVEKPWRWILGLHGFFSRRALTTIVTNEYLGRIVRGWRARSTIVGDVPIFFAEAASVRVKGDFSMVFVSSFTKDEPLGLFLAAARKLPDIQFYVTGDCRVVGEEVLKSKPGNVEFTGFLADSEYVGLLKACSAVICLTTADHTMQRGAYEAVYLGRPVVTSNFGLLRETFSKGAVHVDNTVEDITRGISQMRDGVQRYRREALELRRERERRWEHTEAVLRQVLWPEEWREGGGVNASGDRD
jgi:glycosyltransferase involved in cell wall biosynthesis